MIELVLKYLIAKNKGDVTVNELASFISDNKEGIVDGLQIILTFLVESGHIESVGENTLNDYIKYIAQDENPIEKLLKIMQ